MNAPWPDPVSRNDLEAAGVDFDSVAYVDLKHEMIRATRTLKTDYGIAASLKIRYQLKPDSEATAERFKQDEDALRALLRAESIEIDLGLKHEKATPGVDTPLGSVYMPIEGLVDIETEIAKQEKVLVKINSDIERTTAKLDNISFVSKAPAEVVERQKLFKQELLEKRVKVTNLLEMLASQ